MPLYRFHLRAAGQVRRFTYASWMPNSLEAMGEARRTLQLPQTHGAPFSHERGTAIEIEDADTRSVLVVIAFAAQPAHVPAEPNAVEIEFS